MPGVVASSSSSALVSPTTEGAPQNPDRGGDGTALSDFIFECQCGGDPVRMGEPVRDHRGLESDDGPASGYGIGHLIGDRRIGPVTIPPRPQTTG